MKTMCCEAFLRTDGLLPVGPGAAPQILGLPSDRALKFINGIGADSVFTISGDGIHAVIVWYFKE